MQRARGIPSSTRRFVESLETPYFLREDVAQALGVSATRVAAYGESDPTLRASAKVIDGGREIYLYTEDAVARLEAHVAALAERRPVLKTGLRAQKAGRPTLWTPQERRERQSRQCRVRYLNLKSREAAEAGLEEISADYRRKAEAARAELRAEYDVRFAYSTRPRVREG